MANIQSVPGVLVLKRTSLAAAQDALRTALDMHCIRHVSIVHESTLLKASDSESMPGVNGKYSFWWFNNIVLINIISGPLENPDNEKFYAVIIGHRPSVFCGL